MDNMQQQFDTDSAFDPNEGALQQAKTAPLGIGDFDADGAGAADPLAGAEIQKKSHAGTLLIIVVVFVAIGGLFFMRTVAKVTAAVTNDMTVEQFVDKFLDALDQTPEQMAAQADKQQVIEVLHDDYTEFQVPLQNVQYNPFLVHSASDAPVATPNTPDVDTTVREFERQREQRRLAIEQAAASLRLDMVMTGGSTPLANIGGQVVRVGDTFTANPGSVEFTVVAIVGEIVSISSYDERYDLTIETSIKVDRD